MGRDITLSRPIINIPSVMINPGFHTFALSSLEEGQQILSHRIKTILRAKNKKMADALDVYNNDVWLNPFLFAYLNHENPHVPIGQIVFSDIRKNHLAGDSEDVYTNGEGRIYLPKFGTYITEHPNTRMNLTLTDEGFYRPFLSGKRIPYQFDGPVWVNDMLAELVPDFYLLEEYFMNEDGSPVTGYSRVGAQDVTRDVRRAVDIIRTHYPSYHGCFSKAVKSVVPFAEPSMNSFATLSVHGACFLNVMNGNNEVFFMEDLVHQCGHVIFSAITLDSGAYFLKHPETALKDFTGDPREFRSLYVALHGVFTEALMNEIFDACLDKKLFTGLKEHELRGRFAYILLRFAIDMDSLDHPGIFSEKGLYVYGALTEKLYAMYNKYKYLLSAFDLSNQPYNFSMEKFLELNPYHVTA